MTLLLQDETLSSRRLGGSYPYLFHSDDGIQYFERFEDAATALPREHRRIDPAAILSILSFEYVCLDRTLLQGLTRLPWMSSVEQEGITFFRAPAHGHRELCPIDVASKLIELCEAELLKYVEGHSKVYVLLSGGMDSRVLAALLGRLQQRGSVGIPIETVTWGMPNTRDVIYAKRISERYDWRWHWARLDAKSYRDNLKFGAIALGAEVDPKHLHRMDWFRQAEPNSVVIAASYGDSVGRAEFSSTHLADVTKLSPRDRNAFLVPSVRSRAVENVQVDIASLSRRHGHRSVLGWREIERQAHYMRRMLCHTMCVINRWSRIEQLFVAPETFGFMWSLDPSVRTDEIYVHVLNELDPQMLDMAWARTGARYDTGEGQGDELEREFHSYGAWLREHYADRMAELLFGDDTLQNLNVFDMDQLHWMYEDWLRERKEDDTSLCTQLTSISSISQICREFGIGPPHPDSFGRESLKATFRHQIRRQVARSSQVARRVSRPLRVRHGLTF